MYSEKVKMYNLYDNSFLPEESQKIYNSIPLEQINESYPTFNIIINEFLKYLIESPDLIYKIIKYSKEKDLTEPLILFITNNLYNDILSTEIISEKILIIFENLLYDEISKISNINELFLILTNSKISKLFLGFKYYHEVQNYFNLLIGEIIENYENSGTNTIPLIFKIDKLAEYMKEKEDKINKELKSEKEFQREEANRKKNDETNTLDNIYKMKFKVDGNISNSISGLFGLEEEEYFYNEMNNSSIFMAKYTPDLNKNELNEIIKKYSDNEYIQMYLKKQLDILLKNENIFSNNMFFEHIQVLKDPEKILYYYQRNFNIVKEIILKIYQKFKITTHLIPYSIKCFCRIIYNLMRLKFQDLKSIIIDKYIKIFFFKVILEQFILSSDYSAMINTTIISQETKDNFKIIFEIWKQFIYGKFYKNNNNDYCDYTPFNWFFIDLMQETIGICEKLIDVNMPKYLIRKDFKENNEIISKLKIYKNNNDIYSYSSCFTIDSIINILKIIERNSEVFFDNENDLIINNFKECVNKINNHKNILKSLKEKDISNKINYYLYYEIFYSSKIWDIIYQGKNEEFFQMKEIKNEKCNEDKEINKLIKIENILCNVLFNSDISSLINKPKINLNDFKQLMERIDKSNNMKLLFLNYKNEDINELKKLRSNSINRYKSDFLDTSKININSLIILMENLNEKYKTNNYELLFKKLRNDIHTSINKYNFEILSPIIECLKNIKNNTKIYLLNQENYKNIILNSKLRHFYENEQIEIELKFKYNEDEQYFRITKREEIAKRLTRNINKNTIRCHTIPDFIRKFPNFSKLQMKKDLDLLALKNELNLRENLLVYFHIIKDHLITKFPEKHIPNVYSKIKKRILIKLYNKIFPKEPDADDLTFHFQCLSLSWIKPSHLNQSEIHNDNFIKITTNLFNQMNIEKSYSGKLEIIEKIFKTFSNELKIHKGDKYSTDDIAPICEYALIKAKPERLSSNLKYIQIMMSDKCSTLNKMHCDYLKNYINIIKNCNYKHFNGITEKEFNKNCYKAKNEAFEFNN